MKHIFTRTKSYGHLIRADYAAQETINSQTGSIYSLRYLISLFIICVFFISLFLFLFFRPLRNLYHRFTGSLQKSCIVVLISNANRMIVKVKEQNIRHASDLFFNKIILYHAIPRLYVYEYLSSAPSSELQQYCTQLSRYSYKDIAK